jgi:nitric oxide dioxygenase
MATSSSTTPGAPSSITLLHADVDEASFPLRRQVVTDVLALQNASLHVWYEKGATTNESLDGVRAVAVHAIRPQPPARARSGPARHSV